MISGLPPKIVFLLVTFSALDWRTMGYPMRISSGNRLPFWIDGKYAFKRDVFMSRGWGAGGTPYNLMYVMPKGNILRRPATEKTEKGNIFETEFPQDGIDESLIETPTIQFLTSQPGPNNVLQVTNQQRKQYKAVPHLFVSYGWGPLGK